MKNKRLIIIVCFLLILIFLMSIGVIGIIIYNKYYKNKDSKIISKEQSAENEIFMGILRENPVSVFKSDYVVSLQPVFSDSSVEEGKIFESIYSSDTVGSKLIKSESEINFGPASDKCKAFSMFDLVKNNETYQYISKDSSIFKYLNKTIYYDKNGNIMSFFLLKEDSLYEYLGGKYAIRNMFNFSDQLQLSTTENDSDNKIDTDDIINLYFGEDVKIEEIKEGDKLISYMITTEEERNCSIDNQNKDKSKLIIKTVVDVQSQGVTSAKYYYDMPDEGNLILDIEFKVETLDLSAEEMESIFSFSMDVPVRENKMDANLPKYESEEYYDTLKNYLKKNTPTILISKNSNYHFSIYEANLGEVISPYDYLKDRDFYPEGEVGEILYNTYSKVMGYTSWAIQEYTVYFDRTGGGEGGSSVSFEMGIFNKEDDFVDILSAVVFEPEVSDKLEDLIFYINDVEVHGEQYELIEKKNTSNPQAEFKRIAVIFEYKNNRYFIFCVPDQIKYFKEFGDFKAYDTSIDENRELVFQLIKEAHSHIYNYYEDLE